MFPQTYKELVFIRHGALPDSVAHTYVGQNPVPLSEAGRAECVEVGRYLSAEPFDAVYAGVLRRVRETVEAVSVYSPHLADPVWDARLNEIDFGDWSLKTFAQIEEECPHSIEKWSMGNFEFSFPGGESMVGFRERVLGFLHEIYHSDAQRIAVFSHGGVIMTAIAYLIGLDPDRTFSIWVERGSVARLRLWSGNSGQLVQIIRPADYSEKGR